LTTPMGSKPRLPQGLAWSDWWRDERGNAVDGDREMPIDKVSKRIAGWPLLCPIDDCPAEEWFFERPAPQRFCGEHGQPLIEVAADGSTPDPVGGARQRLWAHAKRVVAERRDRAASALRTQAVELRTQAVDAARKASKEGAKHKPTVAASGALLGTGLVAATLSAEAAMVAGGGLATAGAVAAYGGAYWWRSRREGGDLVGRAARRAREHARHVAAASAAFGAWLAQAGLLGVDVSTLGGQVAVGWEVLSGCALAWVVNRSFWERLWEDRRRIAELARQKAEEAARKAEAEAARLESLPLKPVAEVEETPEAVGAAMAARWREIARASTVPPGFLMDKTWIVPEETREVTAPIDGEVRRIGWEFTVQSEPGALVSRMGGFQPPMVGAREWLAAMLERDPSTVGIVDRPDGQANRALFILTDRVPLGGVVEWKGPAGIRRAADGAIYAHRGRSMKGDDVEECLYVPGQAGGGLVVGMTGGGKTAFVVLKLLNRLAAGILPVLFDPKQLVDYGDFVGVFPIGVSDEHREVILAALVAERRRRERLIARKPVRDRFGRARAGESRWSLSDGPPIWHCWEEFHVVAADEVFVRKLTTHIRFQRVAAMSAELVTQGGGLADLNNSVLRGLQNQIELTTFRVDDHQARLAGRRNGTYSAADLPRLPGMCLVESPSAPPMPLRTAYVHREDRDGSVFDWLYGPDMTPILQAPELPAATVEVFEREGLMDLWRLAQGSGGMERLLAEAESCYTGPAPSQPATAVAARMPAADVLLAIVMSKPGCSRQFIDTHEAWLTCPGWGRPPNPSTVSRAAGDLEKAGLLTRNKNDGTDYRVLPAGEARAMAALSIALAAHGAATAKPEPTAAEVEANAERAAEERETEEAASAANAS
jgi:hypothetical protein